MAIYIGQDGAEVDATQFAEDTAINGGTVVAKRGEWRMACPDGQARLCDDGLMRQQFTQKYPRMADREAEPVGSGPVAA